ncbi:DUF2059 domain-containing protein [Pseudooceanicola sp. 200-1SW]|uniref:DUF2059 domain-containing protein n=1 Tax=Pseudooceanicola sp. 200-1SW TaxID=3425949 RepID=UPI003D7F8F0D
MTYPHPDPATAAPRARRRALALPDPRPLLLSALLALALVASLALPGRAASREEVRDFLKVTGFDAAIDSISLSADRGPAMLGLDDPGFVTVWNVMAKRVFDRATMQDMAAAMLEETLDEAAIRSAHDFYGSDLGQRLVEVENASHLDEDEGRADLASALLAHLIEERDVARLSALDRLVSALDDTSDGVMAMAEVQSRFMIAARNAGVIELRVGDDALRDLIAEQFRQMQADSGSQDGVANAAWTYRDFTTEEIDRYAEALEDPGMQRVYELMNAVQYEVMADRFETAASLLVGAQPSQEL